MFLSHLHIKNFRTFGEGPLALELILRPGLTALVGENDSGKTAIVDALRLAIGTRDQEFLRVEESDYHANSAGKTATEIEIRCKFDSLTTEDKGAFAEHLTYEVVGGTTNTVVYLNWKAVYTPSSSRRKGYSSVDVRSGASGDGPTFDSRTKQYLCCAYLRPLRDAEKALSAGRGSRLSQVLQYTREVLEFGKDYDPNEQSPQLEQLSVVGIGDLADALLNKHAGVQGARDALNKRYLSNLSFKGRPLEGKISVAGAKGESPARLRSMLEKLDLNLYDDTQPHLPPNRGLGSNNVLFMACELLLLGSEEGFPLLLVEEPEAHLHPQRQLRLMQFLQKKAAEAESGGTPIQIVITTHSPNLASAIRIDNLVLLSGNKAFPLSRGQTKLDQNDYGFLERFLDVTKANLFFARGVLIVEGDAENILVPTLARLLELDFTEHGVSVVNVGGTGLRRYARVFLRQDTNPGLIDVPVACLADADIMPDPAPAILGRISSGASLPPKSTRRWRVKQDFAGTELAEHRAKIEEKASGQRVKTFVADEWTFEYDLAFSGLAEDVWIAASLANDDDKICAGKISLFKAVLGAKKKFKKTVLALPKEEMCATIYSLYNAGASKAAGAQYLSALLEFRVRRGDLNAASLRSKIPKYLVMAIEYVTNGNQVASNGAAT